MLLYSVLRRLYIVLHQAGLRPRAFILLGVSVDASQPCRCRRRNLPTGMCISAVISGRQPLVPTQCRAGRADRDDEADWSRFCRFDVRRPVSDCTLFTWPCNIYVSSHVTHVPAPGSACVSQDCAIGRSGKSLDGSRAEHLSIPIPENAEKCPSQRFFSLGNMSRGEAGY